MSLTLNPYRTGNSVGGTSAFVGRKSILLSVLEVLSDPRKNALALYGQRRIGKTSLLQQLVQRLPNEGAYLPFYFDLQGKEHWSLSEIVASLGNTVAADLVMQVPPNWKSEPAAFRRRFLPQVFHHLPDEQAIVLLVDEFDILDNSTGERVRSDFFLFLHDLRTLGPRLKFIFAIGRRFDELSDPSLSFIKAIDSIHVSLLEADETRQLVRLSNNELNRSLLWPGQAVGRVAELTGGHPLFIQLLCEQVWRNAYRRSPQGSPLPIAHPEDVDNAAEPMLKSANSALEWVWRGLGPAERVIASAIAGVGSDPISESALFARLKNSGVEIRGELSEAPKKLRDWDVLEGSKEGYCFRVELLRRWIEKVKPLDRSQPDLESINRDAIKLYQDATTLCKQGKGREAISILKEVVSLNPNHHSGSLLLANILIDYKRFDEARVVLEELQRRQSAVASSRLAETLLLLARISPSTKEKVKLYEQALMIDDSDRQAKRELQDAKAKLASIPIILSKARKTRDVYKRIEQFEQVLSIEPSHPDAKNGIEEAHLKIAEIYYLKSLVACSKHDNANAKQLFNKTLELNPKHNRAANQLRKIDIDKVEIPNDVKSALEFSAKDPMNYLLLLWWISFAPYEYKLHQDIYGRVAGKPTGLWLAASLAWLPLFIPFLACGFGILKLGPGAQANYVFVLVAVGLLFCILLSGHIINGSQKGWVMILACIAATIASGLMGFLLVDEARGGAICLTIALIAVAISAVIAYLVASIAASLLGGIVATTLSMIVVFDVISNLKEFWTSAAISLVAAFILVVTIITSARKVNEAAEQGQRTWVTVSTIVLLVFTYIFLIWFSFFNGWSLFV